MCKDQRFVGLQASRQIHHKFRIHAVASAYPPIAQTEKTFRLPIDYYQVSWVGWGGVGFASCCNNGFQNV